ncbi:hypothetical protein, partial [Erythrobacter sp. YJ-T3-07]|uniref:hypothetical protein n=1 Tax=Erythrobacter sp. YJ-T3-07 TaxID=2793063 RepID=UPI0018D3B32F
MILAITCLGKNNVGLHHKQLQGEDNEDSRTIGPQDDEGTLGANIPVGGNPMSVGNDIGSPGSKNAGASSNYNDNGASSSNSDYDDEDNDNYNDKVTSSYSDKDTSSYSDKDTSSHKDKDNNKDHNKNKNIPVVPISTVA